MRFFRPFLSRLVKTAPLSTASDVTPQAWVEQTLTATRAPGVAMGLCRDAKVDMASGGLRARGHPHAVHATDLWHIGSITKSMTATLAARLVEAGLIAWSDTIGTVLGDAFKLRPAFADCTYADLLTHRSSLPANIGMAEARDLVGTLATRDMMADRLDYARLVLADPPHGQRGAFHYSNAGYVVAAAMMQQATQKSWEELMREHVFAPLNLQTAGFGPPGSHMVIDQPRGHQGLFVRAMTPGPDADNIPALGPAGTVHASVLDMVAYLRAHALCDPAFLRRESWDRLHRPVGDGYAMGWVETARGWRAHDGSNTFWYATAAFVPGKDRVVFMAANFAGRGAVARQMAQGAVAALEH